VNIEPKNISKDDVKKKNEESLKRLADERKN